MKELTVISSRPPSWLQSPEISAFTIQPFTFILDQYTPIGVIFQAVRWMANRIIDYVVAQDIEYTGTYKVDLEKVFGADFKGRQVTITRRRKLLGGAPAAGMTNEEDIIIYEVKPPYGMKLGQFIGSRGFFLSILVHELAHMLQNEYGIGKLWLGPGPTKQYKGGRSPFVGGDDMEKLDYYGSTVELPAYIIQIFSDWAERFYGRPKRRTEKRVLLDQATDDNVLDLFWTYAAKDQGSQELAKIIQASPPHLKLANQFIMGIWKQIKAKND